MQGPSKINKLEKQKGIRSARESGAVISTNIWKHLFNQDCTATVHKHIGTTLTTSDSNRDRQEGSTLSRGDRNTHMYTNTCAHLPCEGVQRRRESWAVGGWGAHTAPHYPSGPRTPCHILEERCHCWSTCKGGTDWERGGVREHSRWPLRKDVTWQTKSEGQKKKKRKFCSFQNVLQ